MAAEVSRPQGEPVEILAFSGGVLNLVEHLLSQSCLRVAIAGVRQEVLIQARIRFALRLALVLRLATDDAVLELAHASAEWTAELG